MRLAICQIGAVLSQYAFREGLLRAEGD